MTRVIAASILVFTAGVAWVSINVPFAARLLQVVIAVSVIYVAWLAWRGSRVMRRALRAARGGGAEPVGLAGTSPFVSLVLPARNEATVISASVMALRGIAYADRGGQPRFEVFVVDDGSTDGTGDMARAAAAGAAHITVRRREDGGGPRTKGAVLDFALPYLRGDVIGAIDADTRVEPVFLECVMRAWRRDPAAAALQVARRPRNEDTSWLTAAQAEEQLMDMASQCGRWVTDGTAELRGNGMFVRRDVLEAIGGWDARALTEDLELSTRLSANGHHVTLAPECAVEEEAVESLGALWGQRRRWAEGSMRRLIEHGPGMLTGSQPVSRKADFGAFAAEFLVPPLFATTVVASLLTIPLPRPADWTVPLTLFAGYGLGVFVLALGGLSAAGERGSRLVGRAARGGLVPIALAARRPGLSARHCIRPSSRQLYADAAHHRSAGPMTPRADLVVCGAVVVAAELGGLHVAEAVGIADGRVVAVGGRRDVLAAAGPRARIVDAGTAPVVPGLHDFHIHLVGLARSRVSIGLDDARDGSEALDRIRERATAATPDAWVTGRGWSEAQLGTVTPALVEEAAHGRPVFLTSHDGHSAWASAAALRLAGISVNTPDPPGGRLERDESGRPTGFLRETALDLVSTIVTRLQGDALREIMAATLAELAALGITGASEAGDYTDRNGIGADAALGDSYSSLTDLAGMVDGRLRLTLGIPVDAIEAAAARGFRTGQPLQGRRTMRFGWAKEYADGALGSGTAALFSPSSCRDRDNGIMRVTPEELDGIFAAGRRAGIGLAVHAIGDRAAATILDAVDRAPARLPGVPNDRMEHVQLLREQDRSRLAALGITASVQPIHAAADRDLVESCWQGRQADAYAWNSLAAAGALLAAGSDAPVESVNPWLGMFAAVHRRMPEDPRDDWRPTEALTFAAALHAYTLGPAIALGLTDEGHLRVGARADLAVLSTDLDTLCRADESLAAVRSELTFVDGRPTS